jgi:hypothetical protein
LATNSFKTSALSSVADVVASDAPGTNPATDGGRRISRPLVASDGFSSLPPLQAAPLLVGAPSSSFPRPLSHSALRYLANRAECTISLLRNVLEFAQFVSECVRYAHGAEVREKCASRQMGAMVLWKLRTSFRESAASCQDWLDPHFRYALCEIGFLRLDRAADQNDRDTLATTVLRRCVP